jgi:phosphoribosylanthranilate isomerase
MTKVKICGITNLEDALLSAKFGADALGFNFYEKSPRYITPENAREIIEQLPQEVLKVGVFVNESMEKIVEIAQIAKLDALQLHGEEMPEFASELKAKTNLEIIKAFRVSPEFKPEDVLHYETDAILLDAYNPQEHGGTGETFDWEIAKKVQEIFPKMYLAGGLNHENIIRAIYDTKAFAVDVCSGIETGYGVKDRIKLINFISKVKNKDRNEDENFINFLSFIQRYPKMIVGEKSLTLLNRFFLGFEMALKQSKAEYNTYLFFTDFDDFVRYKYRDGGNWNWCSRILKKVNNDEEKAVDLFFALLEEFKLEKEELHSETIQWEKASDEDLQKFEQKIENAN